MARLLFIGQAPSADTVGKPAFSGKCGAFLAQLMGISQDEMLAAHEFVNLLDYYPGKSAFGKGDKFPITEAAKNAADIRPRFRNRAVVLLGHSVARAFGTTNFQYCQWYSIYDRELGRNVPGVVAVVPHPSGINRWYNINARRLMASKFLHLAAESKELA